MGGVGFWKYSLNEIACMLNIIWHAYSDYKYINFRHRFAKHLSCLKFKHANFIEVNFPVLIVEILAALLSFYFARLYM